MPNVRGAAPVIRSVRGHARCQALIVGDVFLFGSPCARAVLLVTAAHEESKIRVATSWRMANRIDARLKGFQL